MLNINKCAFAKAYVLVLSILYLEFLSNNSVKKHVLCHVGVVRNRIFTFMLTLKLCISIILIYSPLCHHVALIAQKANTKKY